MGLTLSAPRQRHVQASALGHLSPPLLLQRINLLLLLQRIPLDLLLRRTGLPLQRITLDLLLRGITIKATITTMTAIMNKKAPKSEYEFFTLFSLSFF